MAWVSAWSGVARVALARSNRVGAFAVAWPVAEYVVEVVAGEAFGHCWSDVFGE